MHLLLNYLGTLKIHLLSLLQSYRANSVLCFDIRFLGNITNVLFPDIPFIKIPNITLRSVSGNITHCLTCMTDYGQIIVSYQSFLRIDGTPTSESIICHFLTDPPPPLRNFHSRKGGSSLPVLGKHEVALTFYFFL